MKERNFLNASQFGVHIYHSSASHLRLAEQLNLYFNPLNAELNPICHLLALLERATIVVVSRLRVKIRSQRHQ